MNSFHGSLLWLSPTVLAWGSGALRRRPWRPVHHCVRQWWAALCESTFHWITPSQSHLALGQEVLYYRPTMPLFFPVCIPLMGSEQWRKKKKGEDSLNSWLRRWCHCSGSGGSLLDGSAAEPEELRYSLPVLVWLWSELILFRPIKVFFEVKLHFHNAFCDL